MRPVSRLLFSLAFAFVAFVTWAIFLDQQVQSQEIPAPELTSIQPGETGYPVVPPTPAETPTPESTDEASGAESAQWSGTLFLPAIIE